MRQTSLVRQIAANRLRPMNQLKLSMAFAAIFWSLTASAAAPRATPSIAADTGGLSVSGLTPRAVAVVFGVSRETRGYVTGSTRHDYLLKSVDALGNARVNLPAMSRISIWCVVDLQTGAYAITAPSGYAIHRIPLPASALHAAPNAQLNRLRLKDDFLEVLWVRPGVGVWRASTGDGGEGDADHGLDGQVSIAPEQMEALGASPPPPNHYLPVDTFILVNPDTMEIMAIPVMQ